MPIKGVTNQQPEFPQIGQLRKGDAKPDKGIGRDLTYFRFTSEIDEVVEAFEAAYDGEPRLINVFLPFRSTDENWEAWQEEYRAGGLVHRCDGETMVLWQKKDGSYSTEPKPCPYAGQHNAACKATGRLKVIIPELKRLAYVMVLTTSWHDIRNLDKQLRALESLNQDLRGIPLQLRRRPHNISTPGKEGRVRREKWLLSIEAAPRYVELQLQAQESATMLALSPPSAPEVVIVDGATGEILEDELEQVPEWDDGLWDAGEGDDEPAPESTPEPAPVSAQPELLKTDERRYIEKTDRAESMRIAINDRVGAERFRHRAHLLNAIALEAANKDWTWPELDDDDGWRQAFQFALAHARKEGE